MVAAWWHHEGSIRAAWWHYGGSMMAAWWQHDGSMMVLWWQHDGSMAATWWQHDGGVMAAWWQHHGSLCCRMMAAWWQHVWQHGGCLLMAIYLNTYSHYTKWGSLIICCTINLCLFNSVKGRDPGLGKYELLLVLDDTWSIQPCIMINVTDVNAKVQQL